MKFTDLGEAAYICTEVEFRFTDAVDSEDVGQQVGGALLTLCGLYPKCTEHVLQTTEGSFVARYNDLTERWVVHPLAKNLRSTFKCVFSHINV